MMRKTWARTLALAFVGVVVGVQSVSTADLVFRVERVTGDLWAKGWIETAAGFKFPDGSTQITAATGGAGWSLTGNAITAGQFLGTTNNQALNIRVNNVRALRIEPHAESPNLIGGYHENYVDSGVRGATISGGGSYDTPNRVTEDYGTVSGGSDNRAVGTVATVGGGWNNVAGGNLSTVAGGFSNATIGTAATVGGGSNNEAIDNYTTVSGGQGNISSNEGTTVSGGISNIASGWRSTVSGGHDNNATGTYATVGGGHDNTAGSYSTVGGGTGNAASGWYATVGGGTGNAVSGEYATVGGGRGNVASGEYATVGGGRDNTAVGNYSFVVGRRAKNAHVLNHGVFMFADSTDADFWSATANEFAVRASGGYRLYTSGDLSTGAFLHAGASSWTVPSDRSLKENFTELDGREVLHRLSLIPITKWNYKAQDAEIRHVGPMAQDFYAAFGLGESDLHISTVDVDGIALVSIQALYELSQEKDAQIAQLAEENAQQAAEIGDLRARLEALEKLVQEVGARP